MQAIIAICQLEFMFSGGSGSDLTLFRILTGYASTCTCHLCRCGSANKPTQCSMRHEKTATWNFLFTKKNDAHGIIEDIRQKAFHIPYSALMSNTTIPRGTIPSKVLKKSKSKRYKLYPSSYELLELFWWCEVWSWIPKRKVSQVLRPKYEIPLAHQKPSKRHSSFFAFGRLLLIQQVCV